MKFLYLMSRAAVAAFFVVGLNPGNSAELQKITAATGSGNDEFGFAVAAEGGVAAVGAPRDDSINLASGSIYVFYLNASSGRWEEVRQLVAEDGAAADEMATVVAVSGDLIVAGAVQDRDNGSASGSAYLFQRDHGGSDQWGEIAKLLPSDGAANREFGTSVAIDGNRVAVGSIGNQLLSEEGAVYLFEPDPGDPSRWIEVKRIEAAGGAGGNRFGTAVTLEGDRLAVGAPGDSDDANEAGSTYIYERNQGGPDNWGEVRKIRASDVNIGDLFGSSVDLDGDTLLVGATEEPAGGVGAAYVFGRDEGGAGNWGQVERLSPVGGTAGALFGASVSLSGATALVGAPRESGRGLEAGAAYLFQRDSGGAWHFAQKLFGMDTSASFKLGGSVSINDGGALLVGASGDDFGGVNTGSVYVFVANPQPVLSIEAIEGGVEVSWLPDLPWFGLETSPGLSPPNWTPAVGGGRNPVILEAGSGNAIFRLSGQEPLEISFLPVGNPGNAADGLTGLGLVSGGYQIGEYEVTNDEYARFLNSVARTDAFDLYNAEMGAGARGGIERSGDSGTYVYSARPNMGNKPVNYVSFYDAARFANWLHNGQPVGGQDASTTEDGAYTFTGAASVGNRNPGATVWLPSASEWYKAAYYDPTKGGDGGYWLNPTRSDEIPDAATADAEGNIDNDSANIANYGASAEWNGQFGNVTTVGSGGPGSRSYFGAADMGGNVSEWNESMAGGLRGVRGGSWEDFESELESSSASALSPTSETETTGFRVARP